MGFTWRDDWSIGNEKIDFQHKELFKAINALLDALHDGKGIVAIGQTMKFLEDYTVMHFDQEEELQKLSGYPDYPHHRQLHENFKLVVKDLDKQLKESGPSSMLIMKVNVSLGDWLINHIEKEDKKIGEFFRNKDA